MVIMCVWSCRRIAVTSVCVPERMEDLRVRRQLLETLTDFFEKQLK